MSENSLSEIKNDIFVFSGKELNDINDIKLTKLNHKVFELDNLLESAFINNNSIKISRENININRSEISAQKNHDIIQR